MNLIVMSQIIFAIDFKFTFNLQIKRKENHTFHNAQKKTALLRV